MQQEMCVSQPARTLASTVMAAGLREHLAALKPRLTVGHPPSTRHRFKLLNAGIDTARSQDDLAIHGRHVDCQSNSWNFVGLGDGRKTGHRDQSVTSDHDGKDTHLVRNV